MDPISSAVKQFQDEFQDFKGNTDAWVLRIITELKNVGTLQKVLRAEEWAPDLRSPFLIFDRAYTSEDETFEGMSQVLGEHYTILQKSFEKQGKPLSDFGMRRGAARTATIFSHYLMHFIECTQEVLDPPFVCWLPTDIRDENGFQKSVQTLLHMLSDTGINFIIADEMMKERLTQLINALGSAQMCIRFKIDEEALIDYFKKMLGPPSKGRAPGTLPGAAAPDVEPPMRPGPQPPNDEQIKANMAKMGLPPILTASEGEKLRQLVCEAAWSLGERNELNTIQKQLAACKLCAEAGLKLEESLMTLVLASYLLQFGRLLEAEEQYHRAEMLACEANAYPQIAQARMALGYLLLKNNRIDEAAAIYEQAAFAALLGGVMLIYFESLRMAGTCHLKRGRKQDTYLCWKAVVEKARNVSSDEIRLSSFLDVAGALIKLLKDLGMNDQVDSIEALVVEVGEKAGT